MLLCVVSPGSMMAAKPAPLGDTTNKNKTHEDASMQEKLVRRHTRFDDDGNEIGTVETEIKAVNIAATQNDEEATAYQEESRRAKKAMSRKRRRKWR